MPRPTLATTDCKALRANFAALAEACPHSKLIPMLKANGYGHGASVVAAALGDRAAAFAVASPEEAAQLRSDGIEQPLLLLEGAFEPADLLFASEHNCWLMVHNQQQIDWIEKAKLPAALRIWLGVDTGMHRLGLPPEMVERSYKRLLNSRNVHSAMVICSHFHSAEMGAKQVAEQVAIFDAVAGHLPAEQSLANSAATLALEDCRRDWCRPGIALYGAGPSATLPMVGGEPLAAAMTLSSEVIALRAVVRGERVGYNGRWQAQRDSLIATVPVGYADGYPRHAADGTPVMVAGQRCALAGRVSMDMITVDVTDLDGVGIGSPVELWGSQLGVGEVAAAAQTISYQLLTGVSARVTRRTTQ